jgi:Gpi18-like mannosyltransferase
MFSVATRPGIWFWFVVLLGAALRLYLVIFTQGTRDVELWQEHAGGVRDFGLIGYYHISKEANHPPFISYAESLLLRAAGAVGVPYRIFLRLPFALLDAGTTALLALALTGNRCRWWLTALYWLNPLAIILSAYQGNTDSAIPFFLLLCVWLLSKGNMMGAAIVLGTSLWIKLPGILALPVLLLLVQNWRKRLLFVAATAVAAILPYLPALVADAQIVIANVFGYHGRQLYTTGQVPVWGTKVLLFSIIPPEKWPEQLHAPVLFFINHDWQLALILALLLAWLRRSHRSVPEICATIGMLYVVIYGFSDSWAFQYFAWSLPFWLFLPPWFFVSATALGTAYIYSLYWLVCGNAWLLGEWDFAGHPYWPPSLLWVRNVTVLLFFISACVFLISAIRHKRWSPLPVP